jgi:microcin C transport system permease protein
MLERQRLANPFAHTADGKRVPGAVQERHLLGTDQFGKDVLARLVYGFRMSVVFGLALAITSALLGCILGAIQGFFGGVTDLAGQRLMEIWGALPQLMLLMILSDFLSRQGELTEFQHVVMLFVIMNLTSWMGMAQHMRAQFLRERNRDYVRGAKALGLSDTKIMFRHILPNSLVPVVTFLPFSVSAGIGALVGLDYLGFGLKYPAPSLGELLAQGQQHLEAWWITVPTFLTLTTLTILLVFVGDAVRNAFDPRYK